MVDGNGSGPGRGLRSQLEAAEAIAHIGSWEWSPATGVVTWSDELYRIYGLEPRSVEITFELFLSKIHPGERERIQGEIRAALGRPGRFAYREIIVRPDGSLRTLDTVGETVTDASGAVTAMVGTCRDVTEQAEGAARIRFYADVFEHARIALSSWKVDRSREPAELRLAAFNAATEAVVAASLGDRLGEPMRAVWPAIAATRLQDHAAAIGHAPVEAIPPIRLGDAPGAPIVAASVFPLPADHVGIALVDVTARVNADLVQDAERRALEMLAAGSPLPDILTVVVRAIEQVSVSTIASILLLDETGTRIRHGAAPGLPDGYNAAIDGVAIGPRAGSCGTAMFRAEPVFVVDVDTDPLWDDYRELARTHGLRSCWSYPIVSNGGRVLGTFALYHREPRAPDAAARSLMERAAHVVGIVLDRRGLDEQLRALAGRIESAREDERTSIARDIHDQLGQALTALKLDIGWLQRRITDDALGRKLGEMSRSADDILATVRRISADLRPGVLDHVGLRAAIEWQTEEFESRTGTPCTIESNLTDVQLDRELATTVFRIFQESLTNVARHASASRVEVSLRLEHGRLRLDIADDGIGMPEVGPRGSTLGILGMGERARRLGGECTVRRRQPRGTIVSLVVPLKFPAERAVVDA